MECQITTADATKQAADCVIVGVYEKKKLGEAAEAVNDASDGLLSKLLEQGDISGKLGRATLLPHVDGIKAKRVVVAGLGPKGEFGRREYYRATRAALSAVRSTKVEDTASYLSLEPVADCDAYYLGRLATQALGDYVYRYRETKRDKAGPLPALDTFTLAADDKADGEDMQRGGAHGIGIATGMRLTRDLGNTPPNICNPTYIADKAQELAAEHEGLEVRVLDEPDMAALGMHSLLSVGNGSDQPSKLIQLDWRGGEEDDSPVILVGKGITFDSGGISLKPGPQMDEMKYDMGGAAAVIGTMAAVAALRLPINLTVIVPSAENMPSGRATRPGDVVTSMSGKTIEILNTDAEGRLILCDALTYAQQYGPSVLIDVATLTGACVIALGRHRSGLMSNDDTLADELVAAGERAVDRAWHLPLDQEYADQLKSNFADYANIGGREAGVITAGAFLWQFTKKARWAHLDIAGTAWVSGSKKGATGRPVPLLVDYLLQHGG